MPQLSRRCVVAALVAALGLSSVAGCSDPAPAGGDGGSAPSKTDMDEAVGSRDASASSDDRSSSDGERAADSDRDASAGEPTSSDSGESDDLAEDDSADDERPQRPPCDPKKNGGASSPGKYQGYSEPLYPDYERTSFYVEVRDGTRLAMDVFRPVDEGGDVVSTRLPVLWMHTPYNRRTFTGGPTVETYPGFALRLVEYGYVVAIVDYRGLYASFGTNQGFNRGEWIKEAQMDAYDVTEWLAQQPWSTGKVGMWGCSATGGSQMQAATTKPPSLKAIFPMSCEFDVYPFAVPGGMAPPSGNTRAPPGGSSSGLRDLSAAAVDGPDGRGLLSQALDDHAGGVESVGHAPYRDSVASNVPVQWWLQSSPHSYLDALNESGVAMYFAANWNEGATKYGAFFNYKNIETPTKLLVGPAGHCAWTDVREDTGFDLVIEELRFFDAFLKDVDNCVKEEPPVYYYTYNAPGDGWQAADDWPLPNEQRTPYYYFGDGSLELSAPGGAGGSDSVTTGANAKIVYTSEPLEEPVQVTGHPGLASALSSSGPGSGAHMPPALVERREQREGPR